MVGSGVEARFPDTFSSVTVNCLICAAIAVLRWLPFCLDADANKVGWDFPGGPLWLRLCAPDVGDLGLIPGQGTRSHMLQLRPGETR